jgi:peptidoglycan hydrolase CwlO-like protein
MTVQLHPGKATVPIWTVVVLCVTILIAVVGWIIALTSKASDAEHKTIVQSVMTLDNFVQTKNAAQDADLKEQGTAVTQIQKDIEYIKASVTRIERKIGL